MATRSESLAQDLKAWAADQLQVAPECARAQARAAFFRQLQRDNGEVNLAAREAVLILSGRNQASRPVLALEAAEAKLQSDVDDFGSRFFSLAPAERKAEWDRLRARGQGFVRVDCRLAAMRVGLNVALPVFERGLPAEKLALTAGELFVLRPLDRAARRQAFLDELKESTQFTVWVRAASVLKNHAVAALEPELLDALAERPHRAQEKQQLNRNMRQTVEAAPASSGSSHWPWGIVVVIAIGIIRLLAADRSPPRDNPHFAPAQEFKFNQPPRIDVQDILKDLKNQRKLDALIEKENRDRAKDQRDRP